MVNIDELYRTVQFFANKEQSGFITPSEFNLLADRAQMEMFMKKFGNPEAVAGPMQPYPKYSYQETQKITDDLRPFVKRVNLNLNFGQIQYPEDYVHFASLMAVRFVNISGTSNSIPRHVEIQAVDESELGYMLGSDIVYPEPDYPVVAFYDTYMQVYPIETSNVIFTYLRRPVKPLWAFDTVNNRPVYNADNSINIEFPDETLNEIAMKILSYVGINLREPSLMQYSETQKNAGL